MKKIDKYLNQVDLIDLYITKNICKIIKNKQEFNFIKENIFLLGFLNKNRKNSLNILLDNSEFDVVKKLIKSNPEILNYKNKSEVNLFQSILLIEYFYDFIIEIIEKFNYDLVFKIITSKDINNSNSIDLLISIIVVNTNTFEKNINNLDKNNSYQKIKKILKLIYKLGDEEKTLLVTKLCDLINSQQILLDLLKYINPQNIDLYPDNKMLTCVDILLVKEYYLILDFMLPRINYIYFVNTENNFLFQFIDNMNTYDGTTGENFVKLMFEMLSKSNISKIKNNKNENIFFKIFEYYKLNPKIIKKYIKHIDIYELNIYNQNIFDIIKNKYTKIKINEKKYKIPKLNFNLLLEPTDIGIFGSDLIHNMIYTNIILAKYSDVIIPYFFQSKNYHEQQIILFQMSNNEKFVLSLLKMYFNYFNPWVPFIIIWKNKNNYYFDENLLNFILDNKNNKYIYVRLSLNMIENDSGETLRHANVILIDNVNKIIERFEPYGEINYFNSEDINLMLQERLAKPIGYTFKFIQPYPGFQSRSDEFNKYNKVYGDPNGFCLAWCLLYIETKLLLEKEYPDKNINPIDVINNYIITEFKKDYPSVTKSQSNLYMMFIRYYAKKLDDEKNKFLKKIDVDPAILYNTDIIQDKYLQIVKKINIELHHNTLKNQKNKK